MQLIGYFAVNQQSIFTNPSIPISVFMDAIAILYQAHEPPVFGGILKPMKFGGYKDSGADIGFVLHKLGKLVAPVQAPNPKEDLDWVFPDTKEGIQLAIEKGATCFWLNTLLYEGHPIEDFFKEEFRFIGQIPKLVGKHDDKHFTHEYLHEKGLPISKGIVVEKDTLALTPIPPFPVVIKPIRGRGSKGVKVVHTQREYLIESLKLIDGKRFGNKIMVEQFLPNQEITLSVMPPGNYTAGGKEIQHKSPWPLPVVKRENHLKGIAPYSGIVPVSHNSHALDNQAHEAPEIKEIVSHAIKVGELLEIKAPIRIDARQGEDRVFKIFDINFKPNMTGASREHRKRQDSLVMIAARALGWTYEDLLLNIAGQAWRPSF